MNQQELIARANSDRARRAANAPKTATFYLDRHAATAVGPDAATAFAVLKSCGSARFTPPADGLGGEAVLTVDRQKWNEVLPLLTRAAVAVEVQYLE